MSLADIDVIDHEIDHRSGPPHELFRKRRREAPLYWHRESGGPGFWALTRHEDVVRVSRDAATLASFRRLPTREGLPG